MDKKIKTFRGKKEHVIKIEKVKMQSTHSPEFEEN
jgi:hypothetical protein